MQLQCFCSHRVLHDVQLQVIPYLVSPAVTQTNGASLSVISASFEVI